MQIEPKSYRVHLVANCHLGWGPLNSLKELWEPLLWAMSNLALSFIVLLLSSNSMYNYAVPSDCSFVQQRLPDFEKKATRSTKTSHKNCLEYLWRRFNNTNPLNIILIWWSFTWITGQVNHMSPARYLIWQQAQIACNVMDMATALPAR